MPDLDEEEFTPDPNWGDDDEEPDPDAQPAGVAEEELTESQKAEREALRVLQYTADEALRSSASDEAFKVQLAEADARIAERDGYRPPPPDTAMDTAAKEAVSMMDSGEWSKFAQTLKEANERDAAKWRANTPGYNGAGEPVVVEPAFDPSSLDSAGFQAFARAAQRGGADPRDVPPGESWDTWSRKVDSALGR